MPKILNPLHIVLIALSFVEHQFIGLYPSLADQWEKIFSAHCISALTLSGNCCISVRID